MEEHDKPGLGGKLMIGVYMSAIFIGLPFMAYTCIVDQNEIRDAGSAYVTALRENRLDDAYEMLASETKKRVSRADFERKLNTAELRASSDEGWGNSSTSSSGMGCLAGGVTIDGDSKNLDLYMWRENERWTVHTVAYELVDYSKMPWRCD